MTPGGYAEYLLFRGRLFSLIRPARDAYRRHAKGKTHLSQPPTLAAKHAPKQTIQRPDVDVILRSGTQTSHAHYESPEQYRSEERHLRLRNPLDRQPCPA